jgi:hypothetical protein
VASEDVKSEALRINLEATRVDVRIHPKYEVMREVVLDYVGLLQQTDSLLEELNIFPSTLPIVRVLRCAV